MVMLSPRVATLLIMIVATVCADSASSQPKHGQALSEVFWMHIQKTSSWLGDFLLMWGCSSARNKSNHAMIYAKLGRNMSALKCEIPFYTGKFQFGYHVPFNTEMNRSTVTLFRNPYDRVISSFLYGKGEHQIMFPLGFRKRAERKYALREEIKKSSAPIIAYVSLPGIAGCQAKMVMGRQCGEDYNITAKDFEEAARRIRNDFAFVGLTEESEASAKLFIAMYPIPSTVGSGLKVASGSVDSGAVDKVLLSAVHQAPRANAIHTNSRNMELTNTIRDHQTRWRDSADVFVYKVAVNLFYHRCREYNIATKYNDTELMSKLI